MLIAYLCGSRSFCKIFGVYSIASRIFCTYSRYGPLAGFAAYLSRFHAVRNWKAGIFQPFMHTVHNVAPDILMEGGASIVYIAVL